MATPSSSTKLPRPSTGRGGCARSATAAGGAPSRPRRACRARPRARRTASRGSSTGDEPVAALARLVGVDAVVLDQRRAAGLLLAQLQPAARDAEVRVALAQDAAIARRRARGTTASERSGSGSDALSSMLRRGAAIGATLVRSARMEGVTVVDHVLLRRLLSILRDKRHAASRVPRDDDRRGADPRLRGDARAARRRDRGRRRRWRARTGARLADEVVRRRDPARRARPGRRLPAARARGARRPSRHVPRRGGAAARRLLREHPVRRGGRRGVRRRPDARHRRQRRRRRSRGSSARARSGCTSSAWSPRPRACEALRDAHPDVPITTATIDRELDDNGYIRPGLGDAGDRIFGTDR